MNCNYYWSPHGYQMISEIPTSYFYEPIRLSQQNLISNQISYEQLKKKCELLELENNRLNELVCTMQLNSDQSMKKSLNKTKRIIKRRKEQELDKKYCCTMSNCKKQYASSLALNLHIKTKHSKQMKDKHIDSNYSSSSEQQNSSKILLINRQV